MELNLAFILSMIWHTLYEKVTLMATKVVHKRVKSKSYYNSPRF